MTKLSPTANGTPIAASTLPSRSCTVSTRPAKVAGDGCVKRPVVLATCSSSSGGGMQRRRRALTLDLVELLAVLDEQLLQVPGVEVGRPGPL